MYFLSHHGKPTVKQLLTASQVKINQQNRIGERLKSRTEQNENPI